MANKQVKRHIIKHLPAIYAENMKTSMWRRVFVARIRWFDRASMSRLSILQIDHAIETTDELNFNAHDTQHITDHYKKENINECPRSHDRKTRFRCVNTVNLIELP